MAGQNGTVYLAPIIALALFGYVVWRNNRRRGHVVVGAGMAPAIDAALRRLLAGETGFVCLSISPSVYLQCATASNGAVLAEAKCPPDSEAAERVLSTGGLSAVQGLPNYRGSFATADAGRLAGLAP